MLQFNHVLVPLDLSDKNRRAIDIALDIAKSNGARVTLLHVVEDIDLPGDTEVDKFVSQLEERARQALGKATEPFTEAGVPVDVATRFGKRAREIAAFQRENGIDLIIMSSHTIDKEHPARSLATLSYQVAVLADCNVMLVK